MPSIEHYRKEIKNHIAPVYDPSQLPQLCQEHTPIYGKLRLCVGLWADFASPDQKSLALGKFAVEKIDTQTKMPVAHAGFDIAEGAMLITQTPQALRPDDFSTEQERHRLGRSKFRHEMILALIELARNLGLKKVSGNCAALHYEVELGLTDYGDIERRTDRVFEQLGFAYNPKTFQYEYIIS